MARWVRTGIGRFSSDDAGVLDGESIGMCAVGGNGYERNSDEQ